MLLEMFAIRPAEGPPIDVTILALLIFIAVMIVIIIGVAKTNAEPVRYPVEHEPAIPPLDRDAKSTVQLPITVVGGPSHGKVFVHEFSASTEEFIDQLQKLESFEGMKSTVGMDFTSAPAIVVRVNKYMEFVRDEWTETGQQTSL